MAGVTEGDREVIIIQFSFCWVVVQREDPLLEGQEIGPSTGSSVDRSDTVSSGVGVGIFFAAVRNVCSSASICASEGSSVVEEGSNGAESLVGIELNVALEVRSAGCWGNFLSINDEGTGDGVDVLEVCIGVVV